MNKIFYLVIVLTLAGCTHSGDVPEGLMTKEQMADFLIDIHLTEAKISTLRIPDDTVKLFYREIETELFKKHNITDSIYFKSLQYYIYDVKAMEEIYTTVVDSLSLRERLSTEE